MSRFKDLIRSLFSISIILPLILLTFYIFIFFLFSNQPLSPKEVVEHFSSIYDRYGYELIFLGAFLESLVIINFFVPGVTIVVLGAIFARTGNVDLTLGIIVASVGFILGYMIDFLLGFFGFSQIINKFGFSPALNKARTTLEKKNNFRSFGLGFINPDIGSFVALAAGTLKMNFLSFVILSSFSTAAWMSLWGLLVYAFGKVFLVILTKYTPILLIIVLSIWILITFYGERKK